jgi:putative transcription factor
MVCELCGSEEEVFKCIVEGTEMMVCEKCSSFGKVVGRIQVENKAAKSKKQEKQQDRPRAVLPDREIIQVIVADYGKIIKNAREKKSLKQDELAKMLSIKQSMLHQIESGRFEPNIELARKFEKLLKLKLVEQHEEMRQNIKAKEGEDLTLGDVIDFK